MAKLYCRLSIVVYHITNSYLKQNTFQIFKVVSLQKDNYFKAGLK